MQGGGVMARNGRATESDFELAILGYNRRQVDRHLQKLREQIAEASIAFHTAISLQDQLNEANKEIVRLREMVHHASTRNLGERITSILRTAEEQAAAIRADAEQERRRTQ